MRMKRIRSILPLGYYIKAKREEVAAESEREPITAQPEDKQQDKPEDKSQDKERRKHPGRQTLPAHLELVEHVRLAIRGARCRVDPRCRAKAQHGYDLSNTLISSARVSASKPLPTSTLRPLDNKTARAPCRFSVAAEADIAASSTAISRLSPVVVFALNRCSPDCFLRCRASVLNAIP